MIDYLETLLAEEEEWESALGLPRWPRRGRENEFLPEDRERETAPAPDAGQRGAAAEAWSLEERRRTGGEDVLETIEQAAQEMDGTSTAPAGGVVAVRAAGTGQTDRPGGNGRTGSDAFCVDGIPGAENDSRLGRIGPGGAAGCPAV